MHGLDRQYVTGVDELGFVDDSGDPENYITHYSVFVVARLPSSILLVNSSIYRARDRTAPCA